jgi:hypothetical protein
MVLPQLPQNLLSESAGEEPTGEPASEDAPQCVQKSCPSSSMWPQTEQLIIASVPFRIPGRENRWNAGRNSLKTHFSLHYIISAVFRK